MLAFLSASSSETSWTISGWLNFPARQEDGEKIRTRVHINLSSFIPELIRGSILWPDPCFTPTQNTIPVPSFRFREGPTGIEHLELILFHSRCHHAYGWEGGKELLMRQSWEKLYQAASECLYQELRENSTRMEPRELETISGHSESAINWGDKATTYKKTSRKTGGSRLSQDTNNNANMSFTNTSMPKPTDLCYLTFSLAIPRFLPWAATTLQTILGWWWLAREC